MKMYFFKTTCTVYIVHEGTVHVLYPSLTFDQQITDLHLFYLQLN